jgi:hypothetical protein
MRKGKIMSKNNRSLPDELNAEGSIKPARKVVHRSPHRSVGILACSWIQDHGIEYESQLERRFLQQTLVLPSIKRVIHQPFRLEYVEDERSLTYVPDFYLLFRDGTKVVIEVKPRKFLQKHLHKLAEAQRLLEEHETPFLVLTEKEIDHGIKVSNASYLLRFARDSPNEQAKQRCLRILSTFPKGLRIDELTKEAAVTERDILHMVGRARLSVDLSKPITKSTIVRIPKEHQNGYLHFIDWFNSAPGHAITGISKSSK